MAKYLAFVCLLVLGIAVRDSAASTYILALPEFSGGAWTNTTNTYTVGSFDFTIAAGETIVGATVTGTFGNSIDTTTALQNVMLGGIQVASCASQTAFCWLTGPEPWTYTFAPGELAIFSSGSVILTDQQTGCCVIRLGQTNLLLTTAPVPEPATYAMMMAGLGLLGFTAWRRKAQAAAPRL